MKTTGRVNGIISNIVIVKADGPVGQNEICHVYCGDTKMMAEVIKVVGDNAYVQVFDSTRGLKIGEKVEFEGHMLEATLAPGLLSRNYDGLQNDLEKMDGLFIARGSITDPIDFEKKWEFNAVAKVGDQVIGGDILGTVQETAVVLHKIMVPPTMRGTITSIQSGSFNVTETVATLKTEDGREVPLTMLQKWPVRVGRPYTKKYPPKRPLCSGQRIIDTMFPIAKGGTAAVPGPFGSGKTVVQHQLAKWSDVDIVVYIGCGERGNEMTDVLREFPELKDPRTGESLMKRTVLIANTSDMPVAAREASVYTGITIAEYFRDMGYDVAVIADSTSRWAEALREMSGRLEEMPGEEGYPAYLASRLAQFYERAGSVECIGSDERRGSLTAVGAVSPPGGDLSEPVSQATMRIVKVFWALDSSLAYKRHFPAINWLSSYSLYLDSLKPWFDENLGPEFMRDRTKAMGILQNEASLNEIVQLVGKDALGAGDQLTLEVARMVREDFLQQNAFMDVDSFSDYERQKKLLGMILSYDVLCRDAIAKGASAQELFQIPAREQIGRAKSVPAEEYAAVYDQIQSDMEQQIAAIAAKGGDDE